jgi:hypothetical protein
MAIDQAIIDAAGTASLRGFTRQADRADQDARDMGSVLMADHRSLTAAVVREIALSPDPGAVADFNTVSHVPTPQPFVAPNFVNPQGGPPAQTPK